MQEQVERKAEPGLREGPGGPAGSHDNFLHIHRSGAEGKQNLPVRRHKGHRRSSAVNGPLIIRKLQTTE
ncbi:hypothetical protein CHARACLAT_033533 [Characodon lateralis]|uniref:Uncharacterized protein n=1 Tax=Characodon lateralis TaxID=208331 RepID=A0ABU7EFJ6_9TELE|nr:hypothetical protein [Characodon lateralis]